MLNCVVFDMDGTLLDTERLSIPAWQEAGKKYGYDIPKDFIVRFLGMNAPSIDRRFLDTFGPDFPIREVRAQRLENGRQYFLTHPVPVKPGAPEILRYLKECGIPAVLATSTPYETAVRRMQDAGLYEYLSGCVTGDMCEHGKPAPDIFLRALELVSCPPEQAIIVEDSQNGVRAAANAGCRCIMIPDQTEPSEEVARLAFRRCDSLNELLSLIQAGIF